MTLEPMTPARFTYESLDRRPGPRYCIQPDWVGRRRLIPADACDAFFPGLDGHLRVADLFYDAKERSGVWFICDCFLASAPSTNFRDRFLNIMRDAIDHNHIVARHVVETRICETLDDIDAHRKDFVSAGYCAVVLRHGGSPYSPGRTCSSALRISGEHTMVARIEAITTGHAGIAVLNCRAEPGAQRFTCLAPGGIATKREIAEAPGDFIGCRVLVKYLRLGRHGTPLYPIALGIIP